MSEQIHTSAREERPPAPERKRWRIRNLLYRGKTVLITGSPGFIGAHLAIRLLNEMQGCKIISVDDINDYYDQQLKLERLTYVLAEATGSSSGHEFIKGNIADKNFVEDIFSTYRPDIVVNLAAQAGVRYSIQHPEAYIESNIIGFFNILEACRHHPVQHLVYASSSSVYGENKKVPFSVEDPADRPVSLYAATKKSDELMAYTYSKLYGIPATGLRFFTVYGPMGRPDMFYFSAAEKLRKGEAIRVFNRGDMMRDFTYIDDIVEGIIRVMGMPPEGDVPYALYNIGGGQPVNLMEFIRVLKEELTRVGVLPEDFDLEKHIRYEDMQPGDVPATYADTKALERDFGFRPKIGIREGLRHFAEWYAERN